MCMLFFPVVGKAHGAILFTKTGIGMGGCFAGGQWLFGAWCLCRRRGGGLLAVAFGEWQGLCPGAGCLDCDLDLDWGGTWL